MSYRSIFSPYGAYELKRSYQKHLGLGTLSVAIPVAIFLSFWIYLHPRPEMKVITIDYLDEMARQSTVGARRGAESNTLARQTATPNGVFDAGRLKILSEHSPMKGSQPVLSDGPHQLEAREVADSDGSLFAGIGDYLNRIPRIERQAPDMEKKPEYRPLADYGFDLKGIGLGTVHIPGDTIRGRLNFDLLKRAAQLLELKRADTMKVEAVLVIDAQGRLAYFNPTFSHPKRAAQVVNDALKATVHRPSRIGDVYCPSAIRMQFFICVGCESRNDVFVELSVLPPEM